MIAAKKIALVLCFLFIVGCNWSAVSAISTSLAVVVALGVTVFQFFYQKRVRLKICLTTGGRFSEDKKIYIVISNLGMVPETITRILTEEVGGELHELQRQDFDLPKTLRPHEVVHLDSISLPNMLDKVKNIYAEDSSGKRWECKQDSVAQAIKILRNFIGRNNLYPSSPQDENKLN